MKTILLTLTICCLTLSPVFAGRARDAYITDMKAQALQIQQEIEDNTATEAEIQWLIQLQKKLDDNWWLANISKQ